MVKKTILLLTFIMVSNFIKAQDLNKKTYAKDVSIEEIRGNCVFYRQDSLAGFPFEANLEIAMKKFPLYMEVRNYMHRLENDFVSNKYHIAKDPYIAIKDIGGTVEITRNGHKHAEGENEVTRNGNFNQTYSANPACNNADWELGNFTNWTGSIGYNANTNTNLKVTTVGIVSGPNNSALNACYNEVIMSTVANDYYGAAQIDPGGGTYTCRLGGDQMNTGGFTCNLEDPNQIASNGEIIKITIPVTPANYLFTYNYNVVLSNAGHSGGENPYFSAELFDGTGAQITCNTYFVESDTTGALTTPTGWTKSAKSDRNNPGTPVVYSGWVANSINLQAYNSQNVILKFTAAGCIYGGHFGYGYLDAVSCSPLQLITPSGPVCTGQNQTITAPANGQGGSYSWAGPGIVSGGTTQTVTCNQPGSYTVTVTNSQGCSYKVDTTITFYPNPKLAVTTPTVCPGSPATLSVTSTGGAGAITYNWNPTTSLVLSPGDSIATATVNSNTSWSVTGTSVHGCTATTVASVNTSGAPKPTFSAPTVCIGKPTVISNTTAGGAAGSFNWDFGDGSAIVTNQLSPSYTYSNPGTYVVTSTVTEGGCTNTGTANVTVSPQPTINVNSPSTCAGVPAHFTLIATGGNTYVWTPATGLSATTGASVNCTTSINETYTVTGTSAAGCTNTAVSNVSVGGASATFNAPPVCIGAPTVINNSSAGGGGTFNWDFGDGSAVVTNQANPSHTYATTGTYVVTTTATVGTCTGTSTASVVVNGPPTITAAGGSICSGAGTATLAATGGVTYTWTPAATLTSATGANTASNATITTDYTVTGTDANGCVNTGTAVVTVAVQPTASFTVGPVCQGTASFFDATASTPAAGATYNWSFGGAGTPTTATVTNNQTDNYTYSAAGTFPVTLTVSVGSCSATATGNAVVNPFPTASFTAPAVCLGNPTVFSSTITNGSTYSWTFGDGNTNTTSATPSNTYATAGTFPVSLTVTAVGGCSVTATGNAVVNVQPTASFTVGPECLGTATFFDATASTPAAGANYIWNFGGTGNPNTATVTTQTDSYTYPTASTFPVTLLVSVGNCTATATGNAVVNPFPVLGFTANAPCDGSAVNFTNTTTNQASIVTWGWDFGDGNTDNTATPAPYTYTAPAGFVASNCYPVVLTATASTGCSGSFSATVNVHPNPVAYFNAWEACLGTASEFKDSSFIQNPPCLTDKITSWQYSFGDGNTGNYTAATLPDTIKHIYANCGPYNISLTVTTNNGCTNTNSLTGDTVFCLPVVTGPSDFSVCPGFATPGQTFTTTCANGGDPTAFWFQSLKTPPSNNTGAPPFFTTTGGNDVVPSYNAIAQNTTCNILQDTIYAVAISGVGCYGNAVYYTANVFPTPTVTPMSPITVCANQPVNVPAFTGCPAPAETFSWTSVTTPNTVNTGVAASGTGDINTFTGTNTTDAVATSVITVTPTANGCIGAPTSFNIIINPIPTMTVASYTVCPTDNIPSPAYVTDPANGVSFTWSATNNVNIGVSATGGPAMPPLHTAPKNATLVPQTGIITYVPTLSGCVGPSTTDTICVKPTPFMQPISDQYWCPFNYTNPVTFDILPPPIATSVVTYSWSYVSGGLTTTGNTAVFPSIGPTGNGGLTTLPTVISVAPTLNGCVGPDSTFVIYVYARPTVSVVSNTVCLGQPTSFTATSPNTGVNAVAQWNWDMNGSGIYTNLGANPAHTFNTAGTSTVYVIATSSVNPALTSTSGAIGCSDTLPVPVLIEPLPVANFHADSAGCPNYPYPLFKTTFMDASSVNPGSIATWVWNFGNGTNPYTSHTSQSPPQQTYNNTSPVQPAYYSVSLTVISAAGCTNTKTKTDFIEVYPRPVANFSWGPIDANIENPTINFVNQAQGASLCTLTNPPQYGPYGVQYYLGDTYATNDSLNTVYNNTIFSHSYNYTDPLDVQETYTVTQWVINQYGCSDSITLPVVIQPIFTFYIPNAFSPNGDNKNDGFKGIGEGIDTTSYNMWIFDRWGLMIYHTDDLFKAWDGHMLGNEGQPVLQEDVYVWKVQFSDIFGKPHQYHGTVTLLK